MKNDPVFSSIINFLLPIILLFGCFFSIDFIHAGFFALIYSLVLFAGAIIVFYIASFDLKLGLKINFDLVALIFTIIAIFYVAMLFLLVTDFLTV